jgi:hypothetical protein
LSSKRGNHDRGPFSHHQRRSANQHWTCATHHSAIITAYLVQQNPDKHNQLQITSTNTSSALHIMMQYLI